MKLSGADLISRETQLASARLLVASFITVFIYVYGINLSQLTLFGVDLSGKFFYNIAFFTVAFFILSLVFHWVSDYAAYTRWFDKSVAGIARWDNFQGERTQYDEFKVIMDNIGREWRNIENREPGSKHIEQLFGDLDTMKSLLESCGRNARSISLLARLQIYVWYLAMPLGLGALALAAAGMGWGQHLASP
jgi:hypothetical protein